MRKIKITVLFLFCALFGYAQKIDSLRHGIPKARVSPIPKNVVRILDLKDQMFTYKGIQIYQNSRPDSIMMPFETYLDTTELKRFVDYLEKQKLLPIYPYRYCIHFPGDPGGSETICDDLYGYDQRFAQLEWGREFYEHVYNVFGLTNNFSLLCEDQANLVFFHEAGHLMHCSLSKYKSELQQEKEACTFEREWRKQFKNIFYIKPFVNPQWKKTIDLIKRLRT